MAKRFASEYRHTDGTRWVGPIFYGEDFTDAQINASEYPIQPMLIIGEHIEDVEVSAGDINVYYRKPSMKIH